MLRIRFGAFSIFGAAKRIKLVHKLHTLFNAKEGDVIGVVIHHFVNEKNGRYFNEVRIVEFGNNL